MILYYRFLDWLQSFIRRTCKELRLKRKWGERWKDMSRSGRRYTRVELVWDLNTDKLDRIRPEPGWEWSCPNCKSYSFITESMMPPILEDWEMVARKAIARGYKAPEKPTAATAGCTNCKYRPGSPE